MGFDTLGIPLYKQMDAVFYYTQMRLSEKFPIPTGITEYQTTTANRK